MSAVSALLAAAVAAFTAWLVRARHLLNESRQIARAVIVDPDDHTTIDADGAVRSIQAADITVPAEMLDEVWSPPHLERLARTYWRFLSQSTLGLIRVKYREDGRDVVLLTRPFVLLSFHKPEYEMQADRGIVRWRIARGVLVARRGHDADGYLEIDVTRRSSGSPERALVHVEVEVANFYPSLASGIATWFYSATQSRIHIIVTHAFLRSLARGDLAESRVGALRTIDEVPNPQPERRVEEPAPR
ncbi:MAG: hypothetical protein JHC95_17395 [Solirubrobacteraceae bacterium]|nr:hypothetical protein [Solirubrobacteraceae bacterium]